VFIIRLGSHSRCTMGLQALKTDDEFWVSIWQERWHKCY